MNQSGWDLVGYKRNPVVLLDHGYHPVLGSLPIGRSIDVRVEGQALRATVLLDAADVPVTGPYAEMVRRKLLAGSLFACSVGFRPLDFDLAEDRGDAFPGFDFKRQELTEWSVVGVPCNPDCLVDQADDLTTALASITASAPCAGQKVSREAVLRRLALDDRFER